MKAKLIFIVSLSYLCSGIIAMLFAGMTDAFGQTKKHHKYTSDRAVNSTDTTKSLEHLPPSLYLVGDSTDVKRVVDIINSTLPENHSVVALPDEGSPGSFSIRLLKSPHQFQMVGREEVSLCIFHTITNPDKSYYVKVSNHNSRVLIGNAKLGTIDIADIEKFDQFPLNDEVHSLQYSSINILIHELYEQYHLQVLSGADPAAASPKQLRKAHRFATQKESNYFNMFYTKTISDMYEDYMLVVFAREDNRSSRIKFRVDYKFGNVVLIRRI